MIFGLNFKEMALSTKHCLMEMYDTLDELHKGPKKEYSFPASWRTLDEKGTFCNFGCYLVYGDENDGVETMQSIDSSSGKPTPNNWPNVFIPIKKQLPVRRTDVISSTAICRVQPAGPSYSYDVKVHRGGDLFYKERIDFDYNDILAFPVTVEAWIKHDAELAK